MTYDFTASGNPDSSFSIDRYSGRIAVARKLDYETSHRNILEVQASDTVHNVTTRVIVRVRDENDNPPEFSQQSYQVISLLLSTYYKLWTFQLELSFAIY